MKFKSPVATSRRFLCSCNRPGGARCDKQSQWKVESVRGDARHCRYSCDEHLSRFVGAEAAAAAIAGREKS